MTTFAPSRSSLHPSAIAAPRATTLREIAILGNHVPRQCGIATFTADLTRALATALPKSQCWVLAMNEVGRRHAYPEPVRLQIAAPELGEYERAAELLNASHANVVSVQHEYGIFGGRAGAHVLALLRGLRIPIVTTLHTVLEQPSQEQRFVMDELTRTSERLVVMSTHGRKLLSDVHGVPVRKIDVIPHGIPDVPFTCRSRNRLGVEGKSVVLTFGLLSPDKGIEHVIDALPAILERHPNTVYIVLGATHPHVKELQGESYRVMLEDRANVLGVEASTIFHDRFVSEAELAEHLSAAEIYITPYLKPEQITSGTLAYAVGSGRAVVSTPYSYARELLADGRGVLVPWQDPGAIAREVIGLLDDDERRLAMRGRALAYGRRMLWPEVARSYVQSFERAQIEHAERHQPVFRGTAFAARPPSLPEIDLRHVGVLSDSTGILQHAAFTVPRHEDGYCLDDNARALLLTALLEDAALPDMETVRSLATRYLAFVRHAFDVTTRRFRNFMSYGREWIEERGSDDSHGRAIWALGAVAGRSRELGRRTLADSLFHAALPEVLELGSPRAWAYALLGIDAYLHARRGEHAGGACSIRDRLAERLFDVYGRTSTVTWPWFEERATYANARLSQALLVSGSWMEREDLKEAGLRSLLWLAKVQCTSEGCYAPIGNDGFYGKDGEKAPFDQQPIEACAMVSACLAAERVTGDSRWALEARRAFDWFLGENQLARSVYDPATGGCRDGLHSERPNENQGAESTLSFLLSLVEMRADDATKARVREVPS